MRETTTDAPFVLRRRPRWRRILLVPRTAWRMRRVWRRHNCRLPVSTAVLMAWDALR